MIEWEELLSAVSEDDLKELKVWLFQENVRIRTEQKELEESRSRFIKEREQFRDEMNSLNQRMVMERKRLRDENLFFEKKMQILQDGFRQLYLDRRKFEKDKLTYEAGRRERERHFFGKETEIADVLFSGVNNSLSLKKRYRDLLKIFHPDNVCGDARIVQIITQEYEKKRSD